MSYLKFDKRLMINLEQSLPKEMLRTNQSGAYHCTTIVDCNTRKQHGLLVIPIPEIDNENHVLLSSLDETVIQHGAPFNLGLHKYGENCYSPNGHKYIREFDCENVPRTTFRVGGVVLTKEKVFISHENRILIKYTLVEAHSPTKLQFRPFLAFRNANSLCVANGTANTGYTSIKNGGAFNLYAGYPTLYMQFNKDVEFIHNPNWYKGIEYVKDQERGLPYVEDLMVPGYFELSIEKGETIIFSASTAEEEPNQFVTACEDELKIRTPRNSFYNSLKNSAKQFCVKNTNGNYIIAGYPWLGIRARDQFIALPGLTLSIHKRDKFEEIMESALAALKNFMDKRANDAVIKDIDAPDIPLWAIWCIQQYYKRYGKIDTMKLYGDTIKQIINYIVKEQHPNLKLMPNGLITSNGTDRPISWMDARHPDGKPIIQRTGYLIEFNALWYNALMFASSMYEDDKDMGLSVDRWSDIAENLKVSFKDMFLNDYGYLYDYVSGDYADLSVRPNMVIAIGLDYSPLDRRQRKGVLDIATRELLNSKGLRTLSPKSYGYNPFYVGTPEQREHAYYHGSSRPWLISFYAEAYIKIFGVNGIAFIERMMIGFENDMSEGCIGSISELYDGNPPFTGRGAISLALNVAGVLSVSRLQRNLTAAFNKENAE
ncbi:MAG: glycogen debranching enzyme N-terminal domain-containing protein [Bacteroidales bacterium]